MNSEPTEADSNHHPPNASSTSKANEERRGRNDFVRRARALARGLPSRLDGQVKRRPYAMLGAACVLGAGVGIVLSSRVLRAVLTATATAAAMELTRAFVRGTMAQSEVS